MNPTWNEDVWLNIATWQERSVVNGPGERFVLWVQGCPLRCKGCINTDFLPFIERHRISVKEMAKKILAVPDIEGVTYSGGEPMAQAKPLYELSCILQEAGLTVVCYTGYTLGELKAMRNPAIQQFLKYIDILIDGRYDATQKAYLPWRGSRNQHVHFLTEKYQHLEEQISRPVGEVEFIVGTEGFVSTGIFDHTFLKRLEEILKKGIQ